MSLGIYSQVNDRRFWYAAIPKTGSQTIAKVLNDYPDVLAKIGEEEDHNGVFRRTHHIAVRSMQNFLYETFKAHIGRHEFFATIRNPWVWHASNYLYQKNKIKNKLAAVDNGVPASDENTLKLGDYRPNNAQWLSIAKESSKILETFEAYLKYTYTQNHYKEYNNNWSIYAPVAVRQFAQPFSWWVDCQHRGLVTILPIENNEMIIDFFNDQLGLPVKEIPVINALGNGEKYKSLYDHNTKALVEEKEAEWIDMFNYEF